MILPYQVDVPMQRYPWANWCLIGVTVVVSVSALVDPDVIFKLGLGQRDIPEWVRDMPELRAMRSLHGSYPVTFQPRGFLTYGLVHIGGMHLAGNMLFLFVFGNSVNAKLGHIGYLFTYAAAMTFAGVAHVELNGAPAVGASGAIYGMLGLFVVLFPRNDVNCFWFSLYRLRNHFGTFSISAIWIILAWVGWDVIQVVLGIAGNVGREAHIAGFVCGLAAGTMLVRLRIITSTQFEQNLFQMFSPNSRR